MTDDDKIVDLRPALAIRRLTRDREPLLTIEVHDDGLVNVTQQRDSGLSDGDQMRVHAEALEKAAKLMRDGAAMLDAEDARQD